MGQPKRRGSLRKQSRAASYAGTGVELETVSSDDGKAAAAAGPADYATHPVLLHFLDGDVEARYVHHQYVASGFIGGKLYAMVALLVIFLCHLLFPKGPFGGPDLDSVVNPWWYTLHISTVSNILLMLCLFVEKLNKYREHCFLMLVASHWPGFAMVFLFGKRPHAYCYGLILCCFFFCCFIAQCRVSRVAPFLALSPLITIIVTTIFFSDHFDRHRKVEILYWFVVICHQLSLASRLPALPLHNELLEQHIFHARRRYRLIYPHQQLLLQPKDAGGTVKVFGA